MALCIPGPNVPPKQPDTPLEAMEEGTLELLKMQLDQNLRNITVLYSSYVSCIRDSLEAKGVQVRKLIFHLGNLSAFNHTEQKRMLLHSHEAELEKAVDLYDVFNLLVQEYSSFLNYEIFHHMVETYHLDEGQEELQYPEHLRAYVNKHKLSEFSRIVPQLDDRHSDEKRLVLLFDIVVMSELARMRDIKRAISNILGIPKEALRILDIHDVPLQDPGKCPH